MRHLFLLLISTLGACTASEPPATLAPAPVPLPAPQPAPEAGAAASPAAEPEPKPAGPLHAVAGEWTRIDEQDQGWVVMSFCHAGTPTIIIDADVQPATIMADAGQEAMKYELSAFEELADDAGLLLHAATSYDAESTREIELRWVDREEGLATFPGALPGRYVHENHVDDYPTVEEGDCGDP